MSADTQPPFGSKGKQTEEPTQWKEVKLGRVFMAYDNVATSKDRGIILRSEYIAHLGGHEAFIQQMEYYTDAIKEKILIADMAKWIWT